MPVENTATRMRLTTSSCGQAESCGERDILRPQPLAGRQRDMALRNVLAGGAHIGAGLQPGRQHDLAGLIERGRLPA